MPILSGYQKTPDRPLLDPASCGEDLIANANRIAELAPRFCRGCADYHIRTSAQRATGMQRGIAHDRPQLIAMITAFLAATLADGRDGVHIVIAGSADTAILATCAHAAAVLGGEALRRCRFTVIDRCPTPLKLCGEFAESHGFSVDLVESDILSDSLRMDADLVVVHSLLRFLAPDAQVKLMRKLGGWLSAEGRIILSNSVREGGQADQLAEARKHDFANRAVAGMAADGILHTGETPEGLQARLARSVDEGKARPGEIRSMEQAKRLFAAAGLRVLSSEVLQCRIELGPGEVVHRQRILALLAANPAVTPRQRPEE